MGAYAYCDECGLSLGYPTLQDLRWGWDCPNGHRKDPPDDVLYDIIDDLIERIERLEAQETSAGERGDG